VAASVLAAGPLNGWSVGVPLLCIQSGSSELLSQVRWSFCVLIPARMHVQRMYVQRQAPSWGETLALAGARGRPDG
jgi:hypothetical protein